MDYLRHRITHFLELTEYTIKFTRLQHSRRQVLAKYVIERAGSLSQSPVRFLEEK